MNSKKNFQYEHIHTVLHLSSGSCTNCTSVSPASSYRRVALVLLNMTDLHTLEARTVAAFAAVVTA
jgi:hypothetical protein